ncbi:MAG: transcriptional repressor [Myxococcales bacterium]|nr:transcriptional repressor [Myxococcales bacterium]MDH3842491.1 transcriptional repressor [Myxococcales bacterium]
MRTGEAAVLEAHGIKPSAQRVAIADYVLHTDEHPSADEVWERVKRVFPMVSRATVYNTLNLFVAKGLLRHLVLTEGRLVFDSNVDKHHHFIDEETGKIYDLPWDTLEVSRVEQLKGFDVRDYQVLVRGKKRRTRGAR